VAAVHESAAAIAGSPHKNKRSTYSLTILLVLQLRNTGIAKMSNWKF
jgi:hypothetical protein